MTGYNYFVENKQLCPDNLYFHIKLLVEYLDKLEQPKTFRI